MIILNKTNYTIMVDGNEVEPNTEYHITERVFDTTTIHSQFGSASITTKYSQRHIKCYGNLNVFESDNDIDSPAGSKRIIVTCIF